MRENETLPAFFMSRCRLDCAAAQALHLRAVCIIDLWSQIIHKHLSQGLARRLCKECMRDACCTWKGARAGAPT
jgi:hypothetical protein